jgi:putative chitinase
MAYKEQKKLKDLLPEKKEEASSPINLGFLKESIGKKETPVKVKETSPTPEKIASDIGDKSPKSKEVDGSSEEAVTYLKVIAKNFGSIPSIARDMNVARQNLIKIIKSKGGKATNKADAMFMKESDLEKKLESEREKFSKKSPEQVKGEGEKEKQGMFPKLFDKFKETKTGKKTVGKAKDLLKGFRNMLSPKNIIKVLGRIALPLLIITTIWKGLSSAWESWKETGSIWEAFKAGVGGIVEFLTFGLIDKKMISDFYDWSFGAITGVMQSVANFFGFGDFFAEKLEVVKEFLGMGLKEKEAQRVERLKLEQPEEEVVSQPKQEKEPEQQSVLVDSEGNPVRTGYGGVVTTGEAPAAEPAPAPSPAPTPEPKGEKKAPASEGKPVKVGSEQGKNAMLKAMDDAKITDPTHRAAIMAQVGHESGGFAVLSENLNYKAPSLMKLFPKKFSGPDDAQKVAAGGPESVAERIYGGRMGNAPEGGGEGFKYRGRGFIQLTGKQNYTRFGYASNPDSVSSLKDAAETAIKYMAGYKGDWSNVKAVTKFVNGGYIGLDDRVKHFQQYLNDPTITKVGAAPTAPSGGDVSSSSTSVASDQRQQQKPQTPNVVNAATVNNNTTVKKQLATDRPDRNSNADALVARAA